MSRIKLANAIINRLRPKASDIFGGAVAGGAVTAGARYINDLRAAAREAHLENLAYRAKEALPPQYYGAMSALPEQQLFTPNEIMSVLPDDMLRSFP